jgi:hypothetical protein
MGIKIAALKTNGMLPKECYLELTCDANHGFFNAPVQRFTTGSHISDWTAAMKAGWLERFNDSGRIILCKGCSGK